MNLSPRVLCVTPVTVAALVLGTATSASAAWQSVLSYQGAKTQACRAPQGDGDVRVKVRLNNTQGRAVATGGLNRVKADGSVGDSWTYTPGNTRPGTVSSQVSLDFKPGSKVYLLIGSRVGITGERIVRVASLPRC